MDNSLTGKPAIIRKPAVAGQFYPANPTRLQREVEAFLSQVELDAASAPKAIIAPHAGYIYSGPIAASAYATFKGDRNVIKCVILIGPSHYVQFDGVAVSGAEAFATPLGLVSVDMEAVRRICSLPQVRILDAAHSREHSLEVHLPFLQVVLEDFKIVPLVVGEASAGQVAEVIDTLWGGPETRFVISSDLSHYHEYESACELDSFISRAIENLRPQDIRVEHACGRIPIQGLLRAARQHDLRGRTVDLRNSGDTAGPRDQVVGYGAFAFEERA